MVALPELVSPTVLAIDKAVEAAAWRGRNWRITPTGLAQACERRAWYDFRWANEPETFGGRMLRLFETGNLEEVRLIGWLRLAGVEVEDRDPATGKQWEVLAVDGHFRGKLDGIATGVIEAPKTPHLLECKTHNSKSFAQLVKHKVQVAKPEHYAQMQIYMHLKGLERALYVAKNKDTDELYIERVRHDAAEGARLAAKAERIRDAKIAPARIADDPDNFQCRFCPSAGICHRGEFALRNCRTCLHSTPAGEGAWRCELKGKTLSIDEQKAGCGDHLYMPTLVAGEQVDAGGWEEGDGVRFVTYRMPDGSEWRDGDVQ